MNRPLPAWVFVLTLGWLVLAAGLGAELGMWRLYSSRMTRPRPFVMARNILLATGAGVMTFSLLWALIAELM